MGLIDRSLKGEGDVRNVPVAAGVLADVIVRMLLGLVVKSLGPGRLRLSVVKLAHSPRFA